MTEDGQVFAIKLGEKVPGTRLTPIKELGMQSKKNGMLYELQCECGVGIVNAPAVRLRNRNTTECKECAKDRRRRNFGIPFGKNALKIKRERQRF